MRRSVQWSSPCGQAHVQLEHGDAERGYGEGVAEGIGHAQAQAAAPVALHGGNVGDGGEVIVVEAVTQPQQQAGAKSGVEFPVAEDWCHEPQYRAEADMDIGHSGMRRAFEPGPRQGPAAPQVN